MMCVHNPPLAADAPAAQHLFTVLIGILFAGLLLIPAVSAEVVTVADDTYQEVVGDTANVSTGSSSNNGNYMDIDGIVITQAVANPITVQIAGRVQGQYITNYASLPQSANTVFDVYKSNNVGALLTYYGQCEYGYFKSTFNGIDYLNLWYEPLPDCNHGIITGTTYLKFSNPESSFTYPRITGVIANTGNGTPTLPFTSDTTGYLATFGGHYSYSSSSHYVGSVRMGNVNIYLHGAWENRVLVEETISAGFNRADITIYRDGDISDFIVAYTGGQSTSIASTSDVTFTVGEQDYPISYALRGLSGAWYNKTVFSESSGSAATIYIRDAQTGTLIPGANLIIEDAATEPPTELVNTSLPTGTGQFPLDQTNSLQYRASATADNYTLIYPILFGLSDEGATIVLWMSPDAAPDVPVEEGKSPLYGYAITQGSQQPISGATVSLDGYGSTTTSSTGFYLFNNVTPSTLTLSASAPLHDALSEPVTVDAAPTQHNLALKGHYLLTVTVKDGDTLANVQNATISLSDGQESTTNPATFTVDYGPYTISAAAGDHYPTTQTAYLDKPGTTTATILLTAKVPTPTPPEMPNYPPHNVKFTVQTIFGTPIPGVNVTAQGIQQTPSTNIIERLLGINMTSTPINTELMSGTTDTNGEINFMMVEAVKYRISLYKPDVVNQTLEIYPKEDTYPIIISTAGGPLLPDAGDALRDIRINVTTSTEGDTGHIHIDYNDTTRKTTGLSIQVTQQNTTNTSAPEDVIASHTVANDANVTHTFDLSVYKGQSFFVRLEAEHPDFGTINRDYAVAFKGVRVPLGPLPDGLYIYVAGFGLMLLGGIFGATSATRGVVVIAFAGWLFWGFGWLDDLGLIAPVSLGLVSTIAVMGVIVTRYKEEGYT